VLTTLVEAYEDRHFSINLPDPISAIKFRMEQLKLSQKDLVPYLGSPSKVSEILSGKRALSLSMIRSLHQHLNIPLEVLIQAQN
jgi:HTH-type transcriptional regulator/antitoxin HigA